MSAENSARWYTENHSSCGDVRFSLLADDVLWEEKTPFQQIFFGENKTFGVFFTLDGYLMVTQKDEFIYHEMICHPAMAVNPEIDRVLIIGGGDGGTARETIKYKNVRSIDLVEIDGRVIELCRKFLPQTAAAFADSRVNIHLEDGLAFVKNAPTGAYDLILVDSTDTIGPGEGLFSLEFYQNCFRALGADGILINQHESAFYEEDSREMLRAHAKLRKIFPITRIYGFNMPSYASGYWYFGYAAKNIDPLKDFSGECWESRRIKTRYYNKEIHQASFALPDYVKELLEINCEGQTSSEPL